MFKRAVIALGCAAILLGGAAPAATATAPAAANPRFVQYDLVTCPLPWLSTGYGPLSFCVQATIGGPPERPARGGLVSPFHPNDFNAQTPWLDRIGTVTFVEYGDLEATDGAVGIFRGYTRLDAGGYGHVTYGMQYNLNNGAWRGRWGLFSWPSGLFHPSSGWFPTTEAP